MNKCALWSRILCIAGIAVIVLGGPLFWGELHRNSISELCLLSGSGLAALGAHLAKSRYRAFLYGAVGLSVCYPITLILVALVFPPLYMEGFP